MAVFVNKRNEVVKTECVEYNHERFLKEILPLFNEVRVGVEGGAQPFDYIYLKVSKKELIEVVRMNQMKVTFSIMFNSKVIKNAKDTLYIKKLEQTIV